MIHTKLVSLRYKMHIKFKLKKKKISILLIDFETILINALFKNIYIKKINKKNPEICV